jgi:hypothetical protein
MRVIFTSLLILSDFSALCDRKNSLSMKISQQSLVSALIFTHIVVRLKPKN